MGPPVGIRAQGAPRGLTSHPTTGFTLIELVVATSVSALLAALLFSMLTFFMTFTRRGAAEVETRQFATVALSTLVRELREARAQSVAVWSGAEGQSYDVIAFVSARAEGAGRPFGIDRSGGPTWQTAVYYVYDPATHLLRRVAAPWTGLFSVPAVDEGRVMARDIVHAAFSRQDDLVSIVLVANVGRGDYPLRTAVQLRNP